MDDTVDLQRVFRSAPGRFLVLRPDPDFTIVAGSAEYFAATGTDASVIGRPLFDAFADNPLLDPVDGGHRMRASLARVVATRNTDSMAVQRHEMRRPRAAGTGLEARSWLPINAPILSTSGDVEYIIHRVDEAGASAEQERLAAESATLRRIYETALDSTPDFIYVFDLEHRALYANAALLKTWGVDEVRGKHWMDLGYEQWHADLHDRELAQVIATRAPVRGEIPFVGTNGRRIYDYIFAPVLGADGQVVAVAGTTRDVTDRLDMVARMLESQRLETIGTLASGVAHDFNNVLAAILGNVALAKQETDPDSPAMERLQLVHRAAERARSLVRQILTFSRRTPKPQAVQSLQPIVDEAIELLRSTLPASVLLNVRPAPAALSARVDGAKFHQLVVNLCTNAWQALRPEGGEIGVWLEQLDLAEAAATALQLQPGPHACLTVSDDGQGMDESVRSRIFEPFFTTKPVGQGTGLGLAVVRSVVMESAGSIQVESQPGRGTRITTYFPLQPGPSASVLSRRGDLPPSPGPSCIRVLYVDDDEVVSVTAAALLSRAGFAVTCTESGEAALSALRRNAGDFAVVVTDFNMPGLSGLGLAEAVRRDWPAMPVIIASGLITAELQVAAERLGVAELLAKEEILESLAAAVRRALSAAQAVPMRAPA